MSLTETSKCHLIKLFLLRKEVFNKYGFDGRTKRLSSDKEQNLLLLNCFCGKYRSEQIFRQVAFAEIVRGRRPSLIGRIGALLSRGKP